ncbi:MAG: 50S ribosomal protein L32 [Candidatus Gottesmanbacteria bacterium]|nr:50S ribosomal protein L32 [Candidatus Gottesmanbacteria bacterium]
MAPLPKRRHSTRRGGKRQAAIKLGLPKILVCKNCGKPRLPHRVCGSCGYYGGKEVVKQKHENLARSKT